MERGYAEGGSFKDGKRKAEDCQDEDADDQQEPVLGDGFFSCGRICMCVCVCIHILR